MSTPDEQVVGYIFHESTVCEEVRSFQETGTGSLRMVVVLQEAEIPNRNKRIYSRKIIQEGLDGAHVKERLAKKTWLGEANHPENPTVARQMLIDPRNASHFIQRHWWDPQDSNILLGEVETANTAVGKDFAALIRQGMQASFSMRGVGDALADKGGYMRVKPGMRLVTYDSVNLPSHEKAYMRQTLNEGMIPLSVQQLAKYAAENSQNFKSLNEQVLQCFEEKVLFSIEDGKLKVTEAHSGKPKAIVLLETQLRREVDDALSKLLF